MSGTYILTIVLYMYLVMFTIQFQELSIADYNRCVVVLGKVWPMQVSLLVLSINLYTSIIVAYKQFFALPKAAYIATYDWLFVRPKTRSPLTPFALVSATYGTSNSQK